jgi:hypothetical protein
MIEVLLRETVAISQIAERSNLAQRRAFSCAINLNKQNQQQAVNDYKDFKSTLKELNELVADLDRKIATGS